MQDAHFKMGWMTERSCYQPRLIGPTRVSRNIKGIEWSTYIYLKTGNKSNRVKFCDPYSLLHNYSNLFWFKVRIWIK